MDAETITHTAGLAALAEGLAAAVAAERAHVVVTRRGRLAVVASYLRDHESPALDAGDLRRIGAVLEAREPVVLEALPQHPEGAALIVLPLSAGAEVAGAIVLADSPMPAPAAIEMLSGAVPLAEAHLQTWLSLDVEVQASAERLVTADLLRQMVRTSPFPTRVTDVDGRILAWNEACEELYGWSEEEVLGSVLPTAVPKRRPAILAELRAMGETMRPLEREMQQVRKDGSKFLGGIGLYPVVDEHGRFFAVAIARRLHQDTRVDRLRDEFCDLVSGSLKTPLTSIAGFVQLLGRSEIVEDQLRRRSVLDSLQAQTAVLGTIIDDLLLVSEVREGDMRLDRVSADLVALVTECVTEAERTHPGRRFVVDVESRLPRVRVDVQRLRQALAHLLANAATYSSIDGEIRVTVSRDHIVGQVVVSDAGEGIPPGDLPRVFERFTRGSRARGAGAGVGLYLVQLIAEAHDGSVALDSTPGEGCRAILRLPLD